MVHHDYCCGSDVTIPILGPSLLSRHSTGCNLKIWSTDHSWQCPLQQRQTPGQELQARLQERRKYAIYFRQVYGLSKLLVAWRGAAVSLRSQIKHRFVNEARRSSHTSHLNRILQVSAFPPRWFYSTWNIYWFFILEATIRKWGCPWRVPSTTDFLSCYSDSQGSRATGQVSHDPDSSPALSVTVKFQTIRTLVHLLMDLHMLFQNQVQWLV